MNKTLDNAVNVFFIEKIKYLFAFKENKIQNTHYYKTTIY